jgi:hypothetical protein
MTSERINVHKPEYLKSKEFDSWRKDGTFEKMIKFACKKKKYQNTNELTVHELIEQLYLRARIYQMFVTSAQCVEDYFEVWTDMMVSDSVIIAEPYGVKIDLNKMFGLDFPEAERQVELGDIFPSPRANPVDVIKSLTASSHKFSKTPQTLSSLNSITPLSVADVLYMATIAQKRSFGLTDSFSARFIYRTTSLCFKDEYKEVAGRVVSLNINLSEYSNEEILADLGKLLDEWRRETKTRTNFDVSKANRSSIKKIINNRYILLLDAMIANVAFDGEIRDSMILEYVYPDMDIQPDSLRKTYKKNAMSFADPAWIKTWEKTLRSLDLWDKPLSQALSKNF